MNEPRIQRPALLTVGMVGSGMMGAGFLLSLLFAPFDIGTYDIAGEIVSGPTFLREGGLLSIAVGGLLVAISYMLWRQDPDSRPLMIGFWVMSGVLAIATPFVSDGGGFDITWLVALAIAVWYLYFKKNVAAYYRGLKAAEANRLAARERLESSGLLDDNGDRPQ